MNKRGETIGAIVNYYFDKHKMPERRLRQLVQDCTTEYQVILSNMEFLLASISRPNSKQRGHIREIKDALKQSTLIFHKMQNIIASALDEKPDGQS